MRGIEMMLPCGRAVRFETMREADAPEMARTDAACFSEPWSERSFRDMARRPDALFVTARLGGKLAGYCGILYVCGEGDITNVAVAERFRGLGVGERMLRTAMEWGRADGVSDYTLEVRAGNAPALALYEKLGFCTEGVRRNFYRKPPEDALIMWKRQEADGTITTKF